MEYVIIYDDGLVVVGVVGDGMEIPVMIFNGVDEFKKFADSCEKFMEAYGSLESIGAVKEAEEICGSLYNSSEAEADAEAAEDN